MNQCNQVPRLTQDTLLESDERPNVTFKQTFIQRNANVSETFPVTWQPPNFQIVLFKKNGSSVN